jgi:hypothetical protein
MSSCLPASIPLPYPGNERLYGWVSGQRWRAYWCIAQGYSTMEYLDRRACSRLAHFQRGCGAAVPQRAISVFDSCFAHAEQWRLVPVLAPAGRHQIGFVSVNSDARRQRSPESVSSTDQGGSRRPPAIQKDSGLPQGTARSLRTRLRETRRTGGEQPHVRHETARFHHAARRCGGRVAAPGARAAARADAADRRTLKSARGRETTVATPSSDCIIATRDMIFGKDRRGTDKSALSVT